MRMYIIKKGTNSNVLSLLFALLFITNQSSATVTYEIGATGDYPSIAAAWAAFPSPITEDYILEIASDYVTESLPINLTAVNGASSSNTITIRPQSGVSGLTISTSSTFDPAVFYLDGADFVIIDGRPGGTGTSDFTIRHASPGLDVTLSPEEPAAIEFINDATFNTVRYCTLEGEIDGTATESSNSTTALGGVVQFSTGITSGNSNNTIDNCLIQKDATGFMPDCLLYSQGTSGAENEDNTVTNCQFSEARFYYIRVDDHNDSWTFTNNSFFQDDADVGGSAAIAWYVYMLYINDGGGHTVTGNYFGGRAVNCGGAAYVRNNVSIKGIYFDSGVDGAANTISSNTFRNWDLFMGVNAGSATDGDILECIYVSGSADYTIGSMGNANVFGSSTGTASIDIETDVNGAVNIFEGITHSSSGTSTIAYNTFGDILNQSGGSSTQAYIRMINATAGAVTIDNNVIGHTVSNPSVTIQNRVADDGNTGFHMITNSSSSTGSITNNTIQNVGNLLTTTSFTINEYMIEVSGAGAHSVTNNTIGNTTAGNMDFDKEDRVVGISIQSGTGTKTITGNTIQNFDCSDSDVIARMIYGNTSSNIVNCTGNTIRNINVLNTSNLAAACYFDRTRGSFDNNTIHNFDATGNFSAFYCYELIYAVSCSNNTIGNTTANDMLINFAGTSTGDEVSIIHLIGRDSPTFDNGARYTCSGNTIQNVTFSNAGTYDAYGIRLQYRSADATNTFNGNTIRNISYTGASGRAFYGIRVDGTNQDSPISVTNNIIHDVTTNRHFYGIYTNSTGTTTVSGDTIGSSSNNNIVATGTDEMYGIFLDGTSTGTMTVANNIIQEFLNTNTSGTASFRGIVIDNSSPMSVTGNTIREIDINALSPILYGVEWVGNSTATSEFLKNDIRDIHLTNTSSTAGTFYGVYLNDVDGGGSFKKNYIGNCSYAGNATTGAFYGIYNNDDGPWDFHNNVIIWDNDGIDGNPYFFYCMRDDGTPSSGAVTWYHNTFYVTGTATGGSSGGWKIAFRLANSAATAQNNVVKNDRTGPGNEFSQRLSAGTASNNYNEGAVFGACTSCNTGAVGTITIDADGYVTNDPNMHVWDAGTDLFTGGIVVDDKDDVARDVTPWRGAFERVGALPVELLTFDAWLGSDEYVYLSWSTATEFNNDYFTVERTVDGLNWEEVCWVKGVGNSSEFQYYEDVDRSPLIGLSYYRLKQVDFDGQYEYSGFRTILLDKQDDIMIFPNPATDQFSVDLNKDKFDIYVFDISGKQVEVIKDAQGVVSIDCFNYETGMYTVQMVNESNTVSKKLIIR